MVYKEIFRNRLVGSFEWYPQLTRNTPSPPKKVAICEIKHHKTMVEPPFSNYDNVLFEV